MPSENSQLLWWYFQLSSNSFLVCFTANLVQYFEDVSNNFTVYKTFIYLWNLLSQTDVNEG